MLVVIDVPDTALKACRPILMLSPHSPKRASHTLR